MATGPAAIFQELTILLSLATLTYFFSKRFHLPTIVGEIAIGVVIGQSVLGSHALGFFDFDPTFISTFASLGAIFLLFLIGLESDFRAIYTRENVLIAFGGVVLPLAFGFITAYLLVPGASLLQATFVGATLTATSTAIAAAVLLELGLMKKRVGQAIMGAAVVDDVLGLMVLSMVVEMTHGTLNPLALAIVTATAVAFVVVGILVGIRLFSPLVVRLQVAGMRLGLKHGGFVIAMAIAFLYALVAEGVGLSAVVGAFLAGTMFAGTPLKEDFMEGAGYLGAVFTPIFFISLGLQVDLQGLTLALLPFAAVLVVVAMLTKVAGCALPAWLQGMTRHESLAVGWGMTPRGEVGLIVALTALTAGIIDASLFSVIVVVIVLVSILPAPLFRRSLAAMARDREASKAERPEPGP